MSKTGAEVAIEILKRHGFDLAFGYPGGAILPFYDALFRDGAIRHILVRHEQGAAHMAEGYAMATGKIGLCIATSGPGATNLVTGLADAKGDSVPILAITGQVPTHAIGTDAFQEADTYGITIPVTKYNNLVKHADHVAEAFEEAIAMATARRPGPVLVDLPKDVQVGATDVTSIDRLDLPAHHLMTPEIEGDLEALADALNAAERPLLYVGGGSVQSGASEAIQALAVKMKAPVVTTLKGLGGFPGTHPQNLGMLGMHGTRYANTAVMHCDLIISLGARFDDRVTGKLDEFCKDAVRCHVDVDPAELNKAIGVHHGVVGDLTAVVQALMPLVNANEDDSAWLDQCLEWKQKYPLRHAEEKGIIKPQAILRRLYEMTGGDVVLSTDVGQHQMWAAQYFLVDRPRSFLTSGSLGTMGFGFPAAIGAKMGQPDRESICISGDASFQMCIQELATCRTYDIPVKVMILNNSFLGMVRQWQELFYDRRFSSTQCDFNPDFVKVTEGFGLEGIRITKEEEVDEALERFLSATHTCVLDVAIPEEEKVFPMIPAGATYDELIDFGDEGAGS